MIKHWFTGLALLIGSTACAQQLNMPQYDNRAFHFGFNVATNFAQFQVNRSTYFDQIDTLKNVRTVSYPGVGLGGIVSFRLGKYFDLRAIFPQITFAQRDLIYEFDGATKRDVKVEVESATVSGSLLVKYKSSRHRNIRFYVIGGVYYCHDLATTVDQSRSNTKPVVSLIANTWGYEVGTGLDFYYEYFKFSPEIKLSNSMNNALFKDPYIYAGSLNSIFPKMITISLNFE